MRWGFGRFGAKSIFRTVSAAATAEKVSLRERYRTTLKIRRAFANLRLAVFLPTVYVFHKEGVAVVRRGILRQNFRSKFGMIESPPLPPTFRRKSFRIFGRGARGRHQSAGVGQCCSAATRVQPRAPESVKD